MNGGHIILGGSAALTAALLWAIAVSFYERVGSCLQPVALNLFKSSIGLLFLVTTLVLTGQALDPVPLNAMVILLVSGVLGFGVSDTALFAALRTLGTRRTLMFMVLGPPLATLLASAFMDSEALGIRAWIGLTATLAGVAWVVTERAQRDENRTPAALKFGIVAGVTASACHAVAAVMSGAALKLTSVTPLWSAALRMAGGVVALAAVSGLRGGSFAHSARSLTRNRLWRWLLPAAFLGTFVAVWLYQLALKDVRTGVVMTLVSTSPVFGLIITAVGGEKITRRSLLGVVLAILGVVVLFACG
jgi:drug/metabolite transporter (DMT)-like permease